MTAKEKVQSILAAVKAAFDAPPAPPAAPAPAAPVDTSTAVVFSYPVDGGSTVYVDCSDDGVADIDANDKVYTDPALTQPYPDGTYKVTGTDFGFTVASGLVTVVADADGTGPGLPLEQQSAAPDPNAMAKPPAPAPAPAPAPLAPPAPKTTQMSEMTPEGMAAVFAAFATGTPEDRIANLELVCKALMEYNFGWQIRQAQEAASTTEAINIYKQDLATAQAQVTAAKTKMESQEVKLKGLFDLMEALVEIPSADPKTVTGARKEVFDKHNAKEQRLQAMSDAIKAARNK
jgi:hypothetical protein